MITPHPSLDERARALIAPMLQAADGILDEGWYGAVARNDSPDVLAVNRHAASGLILVRACYNNSAHWLYHTLAEGADSSETLGLSMMVPSTIDWMVISLATWSHLTRQAAIDDMVLYMGTRPKDVFDQFSNRDNQGMRHFRGCKGGPGHGCDLLDVDLPENTETSQKPITDDDGNVIGVESRISLPLDDVRENPNIISELINTLIGQGDRHPGEIHMGADPKVKDPIPGGTPVDRFGDAVDSAQTRESIVVAQTKADVLRRSITQHLGRMDLLKEGWLGGRPSDEATATGGNVCAELDRRSGLVRLHASSADNYLGVPFLQTIGVPFRYGSGTDLYGHPIMEVHPRSLQSTEIGRMALGVAAWPIIEALAEAYGVSIFLADRCPHLEFDYDR